MRERAQTLGNEKMPSATIVTIANICQASVPLIALLAYIPQWAKLLRSRSSASISARSWFVWTISSAFALFYAIIQLLLNGRGWALVLSTFLGLAFVVCTLFLVIRFRRGPSRDGSDADGHGEQRQNNDPEIAARKLAEPEAYTQYDKLPSWAQPLADPKND
jgi:uncharacterized protein with PQ loop repeat